MGVGDFPTGNWDFETKDFERNIRYVIERERDNERKKK